jgi:predicted dinucleotide-binding enzyme
MNTMTTAIIGVGKIGAALARNLVKGGERVVLASRDKRKAEELAGQLGDHARAAEIADAIAAADVIVLAVYLDVMTSMIPQYSKQLVGKIVVDPSNPVGPDGKGGIRRTIPEDESSGQIVAYLLPKGARFVKAFGTLSAGSLVNGARRTPERAVQFYATDDAGAGEVVARLITANGFDPVNVGGVGQSIRIEVGGDLNEYGGLNGKLVTVKEAEALRGAVVR